MKAMNQLVIAGLFGAAAVLGGCATNTVSATENEAPKANEDIMVQMMENSQPRPFSSFCVDIDLVAKSADNLNGLQGKIVTLLANLHRHDLAKLMFASNVILRGDLYAFDQKDMIPEMCVALPSVEDEINRVRPGRLEKTVVINMADWMKADNNEELRSIIVNSVLAAFSKKATPEIISQLIPPPQGQLKSGPQP